MDVTFRSGEGMLHCYPLMSPMFRETREAMDEIVNFLLEQLGGADFNRIRQVDDTLLELQSDD